jgi:cytochrome oxidase Cu insertion factor (SCO1/SenC/PrrC family)
MRFRRRRQAPAKENGMRRILFLAIVLALALVVAAPKRAAQQQPTVAATHLKAGDPAPDFTLRDHNLNQVTLSEFRGKKNVVLAFYVLAFTGG